MPGRTQIDPCQNRTTLKAKKGFTLIELLVVLAVIGTLMMILYKVIDAILSRKLSQNASLSLDGLFRSGRELAIRDGQTLTLEINTEQQTIGLRNFIPELDRNIQDPEQDLEIEEQQEELREKINWFTGPGQLPSEITAFFSTGGLEISGPLIYIQFYPNGTSDGMVLELASGGYLFLPRQNVPARKLRNLSIDREANESFFLE